MPKTSINYQNTIIYKICCNDLNVKHVYVGHTTNFINRKSKHKANCNNAYKKEFNFKIYQTIRENGGWENWNMIKIENYSCVDRQEASKREREWLETLNANLNMVIPYRSKEEKLEYFKKWSEENDEYLKEHRKQYRTNNNVIIKQNLKKHYNNNKVIYASKYKTYREINKEKIKEQKKQHYKENKIEINKKRKEYFIEYRNKLRSRKNYDKVIKEILTKIQLII